MDGNLYYCIQLYLYITMHSVEGLYFCKICLIFYLKAKLNIATKEQQKVDFRPLEVFFLFHGITADWMPEAIDAVI